MGNGLIAHIVCKADFPSGRLGSANWSRGRESERGETVENCDADLAFGGLALEVSRGEPLAEEFHAVHPLTGSVTRGTIPRGFVPTRLRRWQPL